ncbi:MAG: hypothetical protein KatS3mg103_1052 [Phycisphaerales bacterium]|nr:MAG: hypothetical protein KatS3mg103_1052 [Phycisphaerales bacterium]
MRLRSDQLKKFADQAGVGVEALAEAVRPLGLPGDKADKAVRNWLAGRPRPTCKAEHIRALARVVNAEPRDLARFVSQVRFHRGSTQKARLVADLIRGRGVDEALNLLTFSQKRASVNVAKALNAAIADAELADADVTELYVAESRVDEGPQIKRFRPKDRGRAHPIIKQTSHITIGVQERA